MESLMIKMPKFIKVLKVVVVNSLVFSLLQNPFISNAMAAGPASSSGIEANDVLKIANGAVNLYQNYLGQKFQIIQAQIASQQNQKLMSQLSPSCRKPDGTACYVAQAKFFPECQLPASMSNMPANACASTNADPNAITQMLTYESIAQGWMNYYDQMSNEASNAAFPVGIRCLQDKQKAMDSQLTEMMNSLQRLQDRLNQDKQVFRDNNKKLLEDMNSANEELFGGTKTLNAKTKDFSKYFSQSCQAVIGKDNLRSGSQVGLNGILQNYLAGPNKSASDFNLNKASIENDIRREADKIAATIKSGGVDDFLAKGYIPQSDQAASTFAAIGTQIKKQNAELDVAKARIKKALDEVNYPMPSMGSNFSTDMEDFMAGANDYFKKSYINDCVTGADKGIAIPVEDILRSLEQKATNSEGTARNDYRAALKKILESDSMMSDKMSQIKDLESQYPGMTVTYNDSTQNRVTESPYSLFMKTIDKCEQKYVQDDTFANKSNRSVSYQKKVERAKQALAELKSLNDSYATKVSSAVLSQVLDCGGTALKSGSCSEDTLNSKGENFCIASASQCSNEIQGCYAEANAQIQTRKTKMENLAKRFNANVTAMIARSNALYEQQKAAVTNMTQLIQQRFPGTNFEIPKDMFVSMPEMKKDAYGVEMAGDGNLSSFLDGANSMPEKISLLKEMFKRQKTEVDNSVNEYVGLQKSAMEREKGRWASLKDKCTGAADGATKMLAQQNAEGQKRQNELDGLVNKYCNKYANLKNNPNGGCDQAKSLTDMMDKIIEKGGDGRITGKANGLAAQYNSACNSTNNELLDSLSDCDDDAKGAQKTLCDAKKRKAAAALNKDNSGKSSTVPLVKLCSSESTSENEFIANVSKRLSSGDQEKLKDSTSMADVNKVISKLSDSGASIFSTFRKLGGDKPCQKLTDIDNAVDDSDYDSTKADLQDKIKKAEENAKKPKDPKPATVAGTLDSPDYDAELRNAKSELAKLEKSKKEKSTTQTLLQNALTNLASVNASVDPKSEDGQQRRLSDIGQKMDEDASCDAMNTSNTPKGFGGFDLNSFDKNILSRNQ
jgi:hypothetical protein